MLAEKDKLKIIELSEKFQVSRTFLFGSSLDPEKESRDIDIAVEGLADSKFFKFYSELIFALSKPVDLFDMKRKSRLREIILKEGLVLYG